MSDDLKTLLYRGSNAYAASHPEEARQIFAEARLLDENDVTANYYLAVIAEESDELETAEFHYAKVIEHDPTMRQTYIQLAEIFFRQGKKDQTLRVLMAAEKQFPNDREIIYFRGRIASQTLPGWHLPMLADDTRNDVYEKAINANIKEGDIVLDIGTGSGLLAMMSVRAGAAHVYACEFEPMIANLAQEIIDQNGMSDKITVIPKHSSELIVGEDLPERCDVLVTEIFDRAIVGEGALPTITHARKNLLKEDALTIPHSATLYGAVVECPHLQRFHQVGTVKGFDLSPMNILSHPLAYKEALIGLDDSAEHKVLSEPFVIRDFDFMSLNYLTFKNESHFKCIHDGRADAMLLWFDLQLDERTVFSTYIPKTCNHWRQAAQVLLERPTLKEGEVYQLNTLFNGYFDFHLQ